MLVLLCPLCALRPHTILYRTLGLGLGLGLGLAYRTVPSAVPQEYVRKGYDIIEDIYSTKTAAMNFVHELCKARAKASLDMLMNVSELTAISITTPAWLCWRQSYCMGIGSSLGMLVNVSELTPRRAVSGAASLY